ncbi:MAG: dTMP kinase [Pseudomonadota bacterium]|nr:dTMP kinase [Pseudomonadota bacterium]MEC8247401.1 dTMP kinase [Pseudomonadota bacterium]MEC8586466.1 dTMP kinase [Pseudomonadota bacterium]
MRGKFITFEGGEGGGKSTQAARMAGYLRGKGLEVLETREPGGTPESEALRDLLVQGDPDRWSALSELLLITAARVEHVNRLIKPALTEGKWVICDRFADSTLAYQGIAGELGLELVEQLQKLAVGATAPDVTFLLDVRAEAGLQRAEKRGGAARFEKKGAAFHQTLRDGFLALANENPQRIVLIDGEDTFDNVWGQIEAELGRRFKL